MNIDDVFDGEWRDDEYCIQCPYCGDHPTHNHCYVNVELGVFICYRCDERGTLRQLLYKHGGGAHIEPRKGVIKKKKFPPTDFALFKSFARLSTSTDRLALSYLEKTRGVTIAEIEKYNMQFCLSGRYYGRIIIPIYENRKLVCFTARAFMPYIDPPYLLPHYGETILTSSDALFGYDRVKGKSGKVVILVEGVFDAISVNRRIGCDAVEALAIMSNKMSVGQLLKLLKLPKSTTKFYVMLDADAHDFALRIAWSLHSYRRDEESVRLCFLKKGDPDSVTTAELREAIDTAQRLEVDLVLDMKRVMGGKE